MRIQGIVATLFIALIGVPYSFGEEEPPHLALARRLVESVSPERNAYKGKKTHIIWPGPNTPDDEILNESVCSSFCAALLRETYGLDKLDLMRLFTEEWPEADELFEGISEGKAFEVIESIKDLKPGDFLVVHYRSEKKIPTGHAMLISGNPEKVDSYNPESIPFSFHKDAKKTAFDVSKVIEWHVPIIDSSKGPHGTTDTRFESAKDGGDDDGVGEGPIRLLSDKAGVIVGYSWSPLRLSKLWLASERPFVIGRWRGK